jgi:hypothetical protein
MYDTKSRTNKLLALFFGFVGFMQLFDWIFWTHQNVHNRDEAIINYIFTKIAMIFNHLQPFVCGLLIYLYLGKIKPYSLVILGIYTIIATIYSIQAYEKITYTLKKENILHWEWNFASDLNIPVYSLMCLSFVIMAYEHFKSPLNYILIILNIGFILFSAYTWKSTVLGRFWCKFSAMIPTILLLLVIFKVII